jgi:hypothetical protein
VFGDLAFWHVEQDGDNFFDCVEEVVVEAQKLYVDNRARVCAVMAKTTADSLANLGDSFSASNALDMTEVTQSILDMNAPLIPVEYFEEWVDVERVSGDNFNVKWVPGLQFTITKPSGYETALADMQKSVKIVLQKMMDIGEFDVFDTDTGLVTYYVNEEQVLSHLANIRYLMKNGIKIDDQTFGISDVRVPKVLFPGVAEAFQAANMAFTETQYSCALRRGDLTPHAMSDAHVHKDKESGDWPFGWWRTVDATTSTTGAPSDAGSSSSYVKIGAAIATGIALLN